MRFVLFKLLIIFLLITGCTKNKISGYWIDVNSIYSRHQPTSDHIDQIRMELLQPDTHQLRQILCFSQDSLQITSCNSSFYYGFYSNTFKANVKHTTLKVYDEDTSASIKLLKKSKDRFTLIYNSRPNEEDNFIKINQYNMAKRQDELNDLLISSPFKFNNDSDIIEFITPHWYHMGRFTSNNFKEKDNNKWFTVVVGSELFLSVGDKLIHINSFDDQKITGKIYHNQTKEITLMKTQYQEIFSPIDLQGEWQAEKGSENIQFIGNDLLLIHSNEFSDTTSWTINRNSNKIQINSNYYSSLSNYWKILELNENSLVISRWSNTISDPQVEQITFSRQ